MCFKKKIFISTLLTFHLLGFSQNYCTSYANYFTSSNGGAGISSISINNTPITMPPIIAPYYYGNSNLGICSDTFLVTQNENLNISVRTGGTQPNGTFYTVSVYIDPVIESQTSTFPLVDATHQYPPNYCSFAAASSPLAVSTGGGTVTASIIIPQTISAGIHRMRVVWHLGQNYPVPNGPCYLSNAQYVDLRLTIPSLSTVDEIKKQFAIYPNPANDHITIDCGTLTNVVGYSIKITNTLGQEVFNQPMNTQQYYVPLNSWTGQGLYFVNIIDAQGHIIDVKKIILQ